MRLPPLNTLRCFDAAARHLNFKRAAVELHVTQGAVAQQVRKLEQTLRVKLFHREARGLSLTSPGQNYSASIRQSLEIIEQATLSLYPDQTRVRLSVPPSVASKWLVTRLMSFSKLHPTIEVQTEASENLTDFRVDDVDIAIRQGQPPFSPELHTTLLAALNLSAVCSPDYPAAKLAFHSIEDFVPYKLIHDGHDHWNKLFRKKVDKKASQFMRFNHSGLAIDAAVSGQGIALVPELLVETELKSGSLIRLMHEPAEEQQGYYIVVPKEKQHLPGNKAMIEWLLTQASTSLQIQSTEE